MVLNFNGIEVENINFNGTSLDKVIYNGTVVWESLIEETWSNKCYINTGSTGTSNATKTWTQTFDTEVKPIRVSFNSVNNTGKTTYWKFYGSTDKSTWVELASAYNSDRAPTPGKTTTVDVNTNNFYKYFKVTQQNANWRRDDRNYVFSIEPWRIDYLKRKN